MNAIRTLGRTLTLLTLLAAPAMPLQAQTIEDGIMLGRGALFTGTLYTHDSWDEYWEGPLKRDNGNIGTLTTQTTTWFANYGVTDRLNVIAAVPYVRTRASQGVLHGMQGVQDLTVAGKYSVIDGAPTRVGALRAIAGVAVGIPLTDYTPDFQPLSIGMGSKRLSGRFTMNLQSEPGWFVNGSTAYTWRRAVTLDRPFYFTDGRFFMTDQVEMPGVFDYVLSGGYLKHGLMIQGAFSQQRVQGGGDIRRQDMPFVSNRMNFSRLGGLVMAPVPKLRDLAFQFSYAYTIEGRNVGQSTTMTAGLSYRFHFLGRPAQ
jgi:hypothetical protein